MEKTLLIYYVIIINFLGLLLMGIDKRKAVKNHWRIPERTLFVVSLLGGSIGSFVGMYLFRHKTKHLRFTIGIPVILVLQILAVLFLSLYQKEQMESPSTAVSNELALIQELDEDTIRSFVSYENMMNTPSASSQIGPETTEAVNLFFKNFQYHLHSEDVTDDAATVTAEIINIDTKALATDLCRALTARNLSISPKQKAPETLNDYYALLKDTLENNKYELTASTAYFHLKRKKDIWVIQADTTLQDQLVSGFISWMNDPMLLSPEEVLTIYLNELSHLSAEGWREYLKMDDIFATNSEEYASAVDQTYSEKIAEYFSYTIESCTMDGDTATAKLTITSIDMPAILAMYKTKLLKYAHTTDSITSDDTGLSDATAQYLLETLQEDAVSAPIPVALTLTNDGHTWQLEITDELTNALLGNITEALIAFNAS